MPQVVLHSKKFENLCSNASVLLGLLFNKISVMSRGEINYAYTWLLIINETDIHRDSYFEMYVLLLEAAHSISD